MSSYYVFDEVESLLTSSTTTVINSTDALLMHSNTSGRKGQTTIGAVASGPMPLQSLTSASTATNVLPWGITTWNTSNATANILTAPVAAGYEKLITTTSTAVVTITCSGATLTSSEAQNGTIIALGTGIATAGAYASLTSIGTTRWLITGRSTGNTLSILIRERL